MHAQNPLAKSAAEIVKGDQKVMTISEAEVMRLLDLQELLDGLADGFRALARNEIQTPHRPEITVPGKGFLLSMPAWRPGSSMMVKMVCVFEGNLKRDLPSHLAMINLFDEATGMPLCLMDGTYITGIRTSGAAVLSVRELARPDAKVATIVGAGVQGREHLRLLPLVREFDEILVSSLYFDDAEKLARMHPKARAVDNVELAVRESDVVCLCSHSYLPVIDTAWVRPGTHVSSVGYTPRPGELPAELVRNHSLFVEDRAAFEPQPVGCAELQGLAPSSAARLGDVLLGKAAGRTDERQITVYKAMGIAMEDLVAAELVYRRALAEQFDSAAVF
jgi:alanine dehydrogenase